MSLLAGNVEISRLQREVAQLQFSVEEQPKLGDDSDISFWLVSYIVRSTSPVKYWEEEVMVLWLWVALEGRV